MDFCQDFFLTFIYQYITFKSRKREYLTPEEKNNFQKVKATAEMVFKYSRFFDVPVSEETVYLITHITEGSPLKEKYLSLPACDILLQCDSVHRMLHAHCVKPGLGAMKGC